MVLVKVSIFLNTQVEEFMNLKLSNSNIKFQLRTFLD